MHVNKRKESSFWLWKYDQGSDFIEKLKLIQKHDYHVFIEKLKLIQKHDYHVFIEKLKLIQKHDYHVIV